MTQGQIVDLCRALLLIQSSVYYIRLSLDCSKITSKINVKQFVNCIIITVALVIEMCVTLHYRLGSTSHTSDLICFWEAELVSPVLLFLLQRPGEVKYLTLLSDGS